MSRRKRLKKVLVLGIDGLDPARVLRMVRGGELPAFARLAGQGHVGPLATSNPAESPVAWSSLATGCNPGKHGVFDFIHRDPRGYVPRLSLHNMGRGRRTGRAGYQCPRMRPGFWRYSSDHDVPTTVVRWPMTFPAEPVTGRFLAGLGVPDTCGRLGRHTFYTTAASADAEDNNVVAVHFNGNRCVTHLLGPTVTGLTGSRPSRTKLVIDRSGRDVTLTIGKQCHNMAPGAWSEWFRVRFQWGPLRLCDALVKFHLVAVEPELRLLATPPQIDPQRQLWPLTQPTSYGGELSEQIGPFYTLGMPEDTNAVTDGRYGLDAFLQQCDEIDGQRQAMFEHELSRFDDGVLAFVFDASDRMQHMFWCIDDPASPMYDPARASAYRDVVPDLYRRMDRTLATALDAAGDDTTVLAVSDHGFAAFHRACHVNRWLIEHSYMTLKADSEGRSLFRDVDWDRTKAYSLGFTGIYLNRRGRESNGIVQPGNEARTLVQELVSGLRSMRDPVTGARVVRDAYVCDELYWGPHAAEGPDLSIGFEPGYRASWQTALGGAPHGNAVVDNDKLWAADHLVDPSAVPGVLASNLPITNEQPAGVDLAPTVLDCLGLPVPDDMDGCSWLADTPARPPRRRKVPSAEPVAVGTAGETSVGLSEKEQAELERRLSDLGYL